jgi:hypothetical protein
MYKLILIVSIFSLAACSSSKKAAGPVAERTDMLGSWVITDIRTEGLASGERLKLDLIDEGSDECLRGSEWDLPNNGNGKYRITNQSAGCATGEKKIVWSYLQTGPEVYFQFKKMQDGVKPKYVEEGYRFRVVSFVDKTMVVESTIQYAGSPIRILYSFTKK